MNNLTKWLQEVKIKCERATVVVPYVTFTVHYNLQETMDDLDLMRTGRREQFLNHAEAQEFADSVRFKNKPDYWQPHITINTRNEIVDCGADVETLVKLVEMAIEKMQDIEMAPRILHKQDLALKMQAIAFQFLQDAEKLAGVEK